MMSISNTPRLGWFGLGSMGLAIASNLQKHLSERGLPVLHYTSRDLSHGDTLKADGGIPCRDINQLVHACDVIFISVTNDEVAKSVIGQFISTGALKGKILVDTTTVHPNTTAKLAAQLEIHGCSLVGAPVFGPPPAARAAQILIAVAGSPRAIDTIMPFLKNVIARDVIHAGADPSKALLLKSTSNFIAAGLQYLLSEAHVMAEKAELPAVVLESLIEQNFGSYAHNTSRRLTSGSYFPAKEEMPNSGLELAIKDVGIGTSIAEEKGMKLEIGELSMQAMKEAKSYGDSHGRKLDSHSVYGVVRRKAGLRFENNAVQEREGT